MSTRVATRGIKSVALIFSVFVVAVCATKYWTRLVAFADAGTIILYDGELGSAPLPDVSCLYNASEEIGAGRGGGIALKLTPTKFNVSRLKLFCAGVPRRDFSPYTRLEFYVRSAASNPSDRRMMLDTWTNGVYQSSTILGMAAYAEGGIIDGTWRRVSIPISDFKTSSWQLDGVESIAWDLDEQSRVYYIDDITLSSGSQPTGGSSGQAPPPSSDTPPSGGGTGASVIPSGAVLLWNGESPASQSDASFFFGTLSTGSHQGGFAFQAAPDQWHTPSVNLRGQTLYRQDISGYDEVWFYAKTDIPAAAFSFSIGSFPNVSSGVPLSQFVEGGVLTTEYKLVKIPLSLLKTAKYDLSSIETLYFAPANISGVLAKLFVDDMYLVPTAGTQIVDVVPLSDHVLRLTVKDRYDMDAVRLLSNYSLSSVDDSDWNMPQNPVTVGRRFSVIGFKKNQGNLYGNPDAPNIAYDIFLVFNRYMKNGQSYTLGVQNVRDAHGVDFPAPQTLSFIFNDQKQISGSVKTSQVGYLPVSPKFAYLGNYLGDAGSMDISPPRCEVRDASSDTVLFSATPHFRGNDLVRSGEKVYECDFSSFTLPGTYYVYAQGIGRTYNFKIATDVFNDTALKLARLYYYQRAGVALPSQYAGVWAREGGHIITDARAVIADSQRNSALYGGEPVGSSIDLSRGWYDAGDYGKYVLTAAPTLFELLTAYELFPEKFGDGQNNIPESGNGVPDLLDEIKWETDWLRSMQAPDGGVYDRVVTKNWADSMPADDLQPRIVAEKSTHATAVYAASLANAARNLSPFFSGYATDLLARARKAWQFLESHPVATPSGGFIRPADIGGGDYIDTDGDTDARAWAAAELYKSTGEKKFSDAFSQFWPLHAPTFGDIPFAHFEKEASFAYATTKFGVNQDFVSRYKSALKVDADDLVRRTEANIYRDGCRCDTLPWIGWGTYSQSARYSWDLIKAYAILKDPAYLQSSQINLDPELGNNPLYRSFITGVGTVSPRRPLHTISTLDAINEPIPGIPVYGVHDAMTSDNSFYAAAHNSLNLYPVGKTSGDPYPALRRYYDTNELVPMSEFSIADVAPVLSAFSYWSSSRFSVLATTTATLPATTTPVNNTTATTTVIVPPASSSGGTSASGNSQSGSNVTGAGSGGTSSGSSGGVGSGGGGGGNVYNNSAIIPQKPESPAQYKNTPIPVVPFISNMQFGTQGENVRALQKFLNSRGFIVASSGSGSPGNESMYFGEKTQVAIARFQEAYRAEILTPVGLRAGNGVFGFRTRAKVNALLMENPASASSVAAVDASLAANILKQIQDIMQKIAALKAKIDALK